MWSAQGMGFNGKDKLIYPSRSKSSEIFFQVSTFFGGKKGHKKIPLSDIGKFYDQEMKNK